MATEVETPRRIPWRQHQAWLDHNWHPGQHISIIAPTGGGKSYLIRHGLLPNWSDYRVLLIDVKGDDPTYAGFGQVVSAVPEHERNNQPPQDRRERVYRLVVPEWDWQPGKRDTAGLEKARTVAGHALSQTYRQGKWVVVLDETRALSDSTTAFGLGLRGLLENDWQRGRSREITVIAGTQAPRYVPSSFYDMPSVLYIGRILDGRARERLSEIGGDTKAIEAVIPNLRRYEWLVVERDTGNMTITMVGR